RLDDDDAQRRVFSDRQPVKPRQVSQQAGSRVDADNAAAHHHPVKARLATLQVPVFQKRRDRRPNLLAERAADRDLDRNAKGNVEDRRKEEPPAQAEHARDVPDSEPDEHQRYYRHRVVDLANVDVGVGPQSQISDFKFQISNFRYFRSQMWYSTCVESFGCMGLPVSWPWRRRLIQWSRRLETRATTTPQANGTTIHAET